MRAKSNIIYLLITGAILFALAYWIIPDRQKVNYLTKNVLIRDTIVEIRHKEPLVIEKAVPEIKYLRDTVIMTQPFAATIDTVMQHDTIYIQYRFPENYFSMKLSMPSDTLRMREIVSEIKSDESNNWWESALIITAGACVGILIGTSIK